MHLSKKISISTVRETQKKGLQGIFLKNLCVKAKKYPFVCVLHGKIMRILM